ncbi:MAG: hypothetical protein JWP76_4424 [Dactylosporangium sp.]|jgi:hypothetical protein|nr:hypothetical protein [Dactylosporangium sp.]
MGLFDMFKDKAAELIQTAKEQVGEVTGIDLQTPVDELIDSANTTVTQAGQDLADNAGSAAEVGQNLADTAAGSAAEVGQNLADTADKTINDGMNKLTGN